MKADYPLLVIGAGPAGMAAAQTAAEYGVEVAVIDQQAQPGGQIYRNVDSSLLNDPSILGKDYTFGKPLVQAFRRAGLDYHAATSVWYLDKNRRLGILKQGENYQLSARKIVIATGAQERPMPVPGWQLPGGNDRGRRTDIAEIGGAGAAGRRRARRQRSADVIGRLAISAGRGPAQGPARYDPEGNAVQSSTTFAEGAWRERLSVARLTPDGVDSPCRSARL